DINGFERLDKIFLENGDFEDKYYKRMRDRVNFALMECKEGGWDSCFCVSMGSNETDNYSLAFRFEDSNLAVEVKDNKFAGFFADEESAEFSPRFVTENKIDVNIPEIDSEEILQKVYDLDMWEEYNDRCESCGACTASCVTCSCFTTRDVIYTENGKAGERRRNWASCLHEDFTEMAGGHSFRETPAERMRFRTLHKVYDYKERFGENHMCVGCGRCTDSCNELISFSSTINKLSEAVQEIKV
ncbi:MAG: anaerobic sulfite reductase subunit AsrA, partial [Halanaerobiales bacterium]